MEVFELKKDEEYIELNNLIKILGWVATGGQAKATIAEGKVLVNGTIETRKRMKLRSGDKIKYDQESACIK